MEKTGLYAKRAIAGLAGILICFLFVPFGVQAAGPVIIDHNCADIWQIPETAIAQAKLDLHIAYGHTSHGSQLISGMGSNNGEDFDRFMTANGATPGLYLWNNGGSDGALDLHDYFVPGDLGNPDRTTWAQRTRDYLNNPANADVNVVIWSWCGQADTSIANIDIYLNLMEGLIADYPNVNFVFMTGHLNGTGAGGRLNAANEHIRNHCRTNNRILFDFADIESYDPDGLVNYMELMANDACDYNDGNWALEWQASHVQDVDWWASGAAHSQHLNGNLKGYAAWWLWASLAGWNQDPCVPAPSALNADINPDQTRVTLAWTDNSQDMNETEFIIQRRENTGAWDNDYARVGADATQYVDTNVAQSSYAYRVIAYFDGNGGDPCYSGASNTVAVQIADEVPSDPSNLVSALTDIGIELAWTDNSDNEDSFILERRTDSADFVELAQLPQDTTAYLDDTMLALHTYTYRVKAVNNAGESGYSNQADEYVPELTLTLSLKQGVDGYQGCTDTYLDSVNDQVNYGNTLYKNIGGAFPVNMPIKFELPENLSNKVIHEAKLIFYCWSVSNYVEGSDLKLCELTESWDENNATWQSRQAGVDWSVPGGAYCAQPVSTVPIQNQAFYPEFDVTSLVQQWADHSIVNNGLVLVNDTLTVTGIKASEYSEYGRPSLQIRYSTKPVCTADQDSDADVDGMDLALFANGYTPDCLETFAGTFGN